ncbi:hypothetical protein OQA88_8688 [Cercophora sp. LCS_1]
MVWSFREEDNLDYSTPGPETYPSRFATPPGAPSPDAGGGRPGASRFGSATTRASRSSSSKKGSKAKAKGKSPKTTGATITTLAGNQPSRRTPTSTMPAASASYCQPQPPVRQQYNQYNNQGGNWPGYTNPSPAGAGASFGGPTTVSRGPSMASYQVSYGQGAYSAQPQQNMNLTGATNFRTWQPEEEEEDESAWYYD